MKTRKKVALSGRLVEEGRSSTRQLIDGHLEPKDCFYLLVFFLKTGIKLNIFLVRKRKGSRQEEMEITGLKKRNEKGKVRETSAPGKTGAMGPAEHGEVNRLF